MHACVCSQPREHRMFCWVSLCLIPLRQGFSLSLVPVILLHPQPLHTEHCSYTCPPVSLSGSASAPHCTLHLKHVHVEQCSYWCMHGHTQVFLWVLGSKPGSSGLHSKCFYVQSPENLTREGKSEEKTRYADQPTEKQGSGGTCSLC